MADEPSQEELLKQQKANCIFCKIIAGEIPSKKVYEDERMVAILDINPSTKGHTLVMTKEHYPIMPLIPPDEFAHLFGTTAALSGAVRDGALAQGCTTFIANGAVAGQQSPHFLFHLIPREQGDTLSMLDPPTGKVDQAEVGQLIQANLLPVMRQHLTRQGKVALLEPEAPRPTEQELPGEPVPEPIQEVAPPPAPAQPTAPQTPPVNIDQLSHIIEENPEVKALLINNPGKLKAMVDQNPQFKAIFGGIDIEALGAQVRKVYFAQHPEAKVDAEQGRAEQSTDPTTAKPVSRAETSNVADDLRPAREMTMKELFAFIDTKSRLKEFIIYDPEHLKRLIPGNERLRVFFEGSNVNAIIQAYQEHAKATDNVRVTMEPEERKQNGDVRTLPGPTREEQEDAYEEVAEPRHRLDKISRLFR